MFTPEQKQAFFSSNKDAIMATWKKDGGTMGEIINNMMKSISPVVSPVVEEKSIISSFAKKFLVLENSVSDIWESIQNSKTILFVKPVQSGKTGDVLRVVEHLYKTHIIIFVSDKNKALAGQTNNRTKVLGWEVKDFRDINNLRPAFAYCMEHEKLLIAGKGKKKIAHFLMEVNNIDVLIMLLTCLPGNLPIALIVDEGDKNRNTLKSEEVSDDEEDEDNSEFNQLPPITRGLLACKNILHDKDNGSKTILVTATPQGILCSEKDEDRLVVYKKPFDNYNGPGLNHSVNIELVECMPTNNPCKPIDRWYGDERRVQNTHYEGVSQAVTRFIGLSTRDESVKQIMLVSLESINDHQERMARVIRNLLTRGGADDEIGIIVFNGLAKNKDKDAPLLSDKIAKMTQRKIVIVAGFMASRGVSFTDFSNPGNKHELVIQVHAAKKIDPLNSSMQAMRIYGPARRTISRAILFCNTTTYKDNLYNFKEVYRVCQDLAEGKKIVYQNNYDPNRPLTQKNNMRYMKQGYANNTLLFESHN
ncbi:MAG: hypothetical protein JHC33_12365, partial [Ignisphaera sp.]|nr:hypothetical protein [Ignisphaera sp.]